MINKNCIIKYYSQNFFLSLTVSHNNVLGTINSRHLSSSGRRSTLLYSVTFTKPNGTKELVENLTEKDFWKEIIIISSTADKEKTLLPTSSSLNSSCGPHNSSTTTKKSTDGLATLSTVNEELVKDGTKEVEEMLSTKNSQALSEEEVVLIINSSSSSDSFSAAAAVVSSVEIKDKVSLLTIMTTTVEDEIVSPTTAVEAAAIIDRNNNISSLLLLPTSVAEIVVSGEITSGSSSSSTSSSREEEEPVSNSSSSFVVSLLSDESRIIVQVLKKKIESKDVQTSDLFDVYLGDKTDPNWQLRFFSAEVIQNSIPNNNKRMLTGQVFVQVPSDNQLYYTCLIQINRNTGLWKHLLRMIISD